MLHTENGIRLKEIATHISYSCNDPPPGGSLATDNAKNLKISSCIILKHAHSSFDGVLLFILSAQAVVDFDLQSNIIPRTKSLTLLSHIQISQLHKQYELKLEKEITDVIKTSIRRHYKGR